MAYKWCCGGYVHPSAAHSLGKPPSIVYMLPAMEGGSHRRQFVSCVRHIEEHQFADDDGRIGTLALITILALAAFMSPESLNLSFANSPMTDASNPNSGVPAFHNRLEFKTDGSQPRYKTLPTSTPAQANQLGRYQQGRGCHVDGLRSQGPLTPVQADLLGTHLEADGLQAGTARPEQLGAEGQDDLAQCG